MAERRSSNVRKGKKKKKNNKISKSLLIGGEVVALIVVVLVLIFVIKATKSQKVNINIPDPVDPVVNENNVTLDPIDKSDPAVAEVMDNYTTIACFGVDSRGKELQKGTRTDCIIICAINNDTGEARLASVYRDTLLNTNTKESPSYEKCNAAYAYGGPERAINMLNNCLDLYIDKFVTVGFNGVISTIDAVGGVDIDVQQNEIKYLNDYQSSMYSTETNTVITDNYVAVTQPGMQTLSGYQALAYCRIRYTAGDDYKRTERQRNVVTQIVEKSKKLKPQAINKICNDVFPLVATNMDLTEDIIPMALDVSKYTIVDSTGFPFSDKITSGLLGGLGSCVIPLKYEENVEELHKFLYPNLEYEASEAVKEVGQGIRNTTSPYGI